MMEWNEFALKFDSVHSKFNFKILNQYPKLTRTELRVSQCLRMNMSTSEISTLLNVSRRGIESHRLRLRKKFLMKKADTLFRFLSQNF